MRNKSKDFIYTASTMSTAEGAGLQFPSDHQLRCMMNRRMDATGLKHPEITVHVEEALRSKLLQADSQE